jgi:hypothetical protein
MANRRINAETLARLKRRARQNERSQEDDFSTRLEQVHARFAGRTFSDSAELVREDRER